MKRTLICLVAASGLVLGAAALDAQPRKERKEAKEARKDARKARKDARKSTAEQKAAREKLRKARGKEDRKEAREELREERKEAREDRKEARELTREAKKETGEARRATRKRNHKRLRERLATLRKKAYVSGYTPTDKKVIIRGANFSGDVVVTVGGKPVKAVVTPSRIVFDASASGAIVVKAGPRRIVVGNYDAKIALGKAARKKRRAERQKRAKERMKARWKARAKSKEERQKRYEERKARREATRAERALRRAAAVRAKFKRAFLASEPAQLELSIHAARRARLLRMQTLASIDDREKLALRIEVLLEREDERHDRRMAILKADFKGAK